MSASPSNSEPSAPMSQIRKGGRATIRMVAERAGVSTATVSYVLSGRGPGNRDSGVKPETKERVHKAAKELGYQPNQAARTVRTGRTQTVLLSMTILADPWALEVVNTISRHVRGRGLIPLIMADDDWNLALHRTQADAVFIDNVREHQREAVAELAERGMKLIVLDPVLEPAGFDVVRSLGLDGCRELVDQLLDDWVDVACLSPFTDSSVRTRFSMYTDAHADRGLQVRADRVQQISETSDSAYAGAISLLSGPTRPKAIYATSDYIAIAAVHAARSLGLRVGVDVAIAGVGNTLAGVALDPPLTSVGPDRFLDYLGELVADVATGQRTPGQLHDFPWHVQTRASTGHP